MHTARDELSAGIRSLTGNTPDLNASISEATLVVGLRNDHELIEQACRAKEWDRLGEDGFVIRFIQEGGAERIVVGGNTDRGALYGTFRLLMLLAEGKEPHEVDTLECPANGIRMLNHWDNMDGSIERGYAGDSIFYRDHHFEWDENRVRDYARLLASVGINAISINNVNVHETETKLITSEPLPNRRGAK